jgi:ribosomal protein L11
MTKKKIFRYVSFYAKAGEVGTTPPIGPMLGQFPMDVKNFCNNFNNETKNYDKGVLLRVILTLYKDSTFEYKITSSPISFLFELAANVLQISNNYRKYKGVSLYNIYLITLIKNSEYKLINIKYMFKKILKAAKKGGYKIIEKSCEFYYYIYI